MLSVYLVGGRPRFRLSVLLRYSRNFLVHIPLFMSRICNIHLHFAFIIHFRTSSHSFFYEFPHFALRPDTYIYQGSTFYMESIKMLLFWTNLLFSYIYLILCFYLLWLCVRTTLSAKTFLFFFVSAS